MNVWRVMTLVAPLTVALSMTATPVHANRRGGPCREDVKKLCPDLKRGSGGVGDCLNQHAAELSAACQDHLSKIKAKMDAWRQACQDDVQKFCNDIDAGHGKIIKCLHKNHDGLSQSCQDQLAQHRRHRQRHDQSASPPRGKPGKS